MRLLTLLTSVCGALALATGPVHRPTDQQAVDGDASLSLENVALVAHEITRRDEKASLSVEKRNSIFNGIKLPTIASPQSAAIYGIKIIYNMAGHWVKVNKEYVYQYYVESIKVINELAERMEVELISAGQTFIAAHLSESQEVTGTPPAGAETYALVLREVHTGL
ncbi:hypothetical protein E4U22_002965 [Claviceps purpurea]|nr:hypothetical protein E4U38_007903 [Claviceps purpurea]KAG6197731.1 hypothetical protein E4U10_007935 [Claviceps purpurea]KAG6215908.1 hypothetical protein E4U50_006819 [Claviceps purpurea]KAG6246580.1 hypothetical protein E4U24_003615 [Claviceps purpurea]KAG6308589.1 hypothetical protein E4U45_000083 [Claviceps purpurea]